MSFGAPSLKGRALRYLAQREHSRVELQRKLARFVEPRLDVSAAEQINTVLDELEQKGFLNEQRAAESIVNSKGARLGGRRLKQIMAARGITPDLAGPLLAQARSTEFERARELWRRKFGEPAVDAAARAKQVRFLLGRGFEGDVIRRVVRGSADDD